MHVHLLTFFAQQTMSMSNGHDGISSELLKLVNDDISSCITLIINQSLTTGIFPDKLKIA